MGGPAAIGTPPSVAPAVFAHLIMVAGIVVIAVGDELVIEHPLGHTPPAWITVILGGPALFIAGRGMFEYRVFARVSRSRLIGVLLLAATSPAAFFLPPLLVAIAPALVLAGIAVSDAARARGRPPEPPSPPS
ncbi:low temperature requirement protein A [Micromonospora sp. NPDC004540]|uniref:low temperature requirement protein A n=1 Tax=Micromonospora sp. NPDC004540 TaxID=3154457 RepID=UPI0033AED5D8